jgi:3-phosphoshikimate 1-carboxyvinyltransferase
MQTISGIIRVPPDKSIAQRAVILAAVAAGSTSLLNYPTSGDPDSTLRAVSQLGGIETERQGASVVVHSPGIEDLSEADDVLDLGNSGTGMRLLLGVLTGPLDKT